MSRDFTAETPGTKLAGDITYIPTSEGWVYLATVIDCYSKMVIGWAKADHYRTSIICTALDSAAGTIDIQPDCIFRSDCGSNYPSQDFAAKLAWMSMRQSVGRTGACWDMPWPNPSSVHSRTNGSPIWSSPHGTQARQEVVKYIEGIYNSSRLHSGLGYKTHSRSTPST